MPNELEDSVAGMMSDFLAVAGTEVTYTRNASTNSAGRTQGGQSWPITMHKRPQPPLAIDTGGIVTQMILTDFITDPANLPFGDPLQGDRITVNGEVYSVQPLEGDKCFRKAADSMIRIHTKRVV